MMLLIGGWLSDLDQGFEVVQYITLRAIFSALTAMAGVVGLVCHRGFWCYRLG